MGTINVGTHYNNFSELTKEEIEVSDNTARKILNGKTSLSKAEFQNTSLFEEFKNNKNFIKLVDSFGQDIDAEELSFLVTVLDASKYNAYVDNKNINLFKTDGSYVHGPDDMENVQDYKESSEPDPGIGFYLDGIYSNSIDDILETSHEDFEQFKKARENANKPQMGL